MKLEEIIENARKNVRKRKWRCMFSNCQSTSIRSHVLQKNGILDGMTTNRHLIQPFVPSMFGNNKNSMIEFGLVGLNKVFTFPGFCSKHDREIFQSIEKKDLINFNKEKTQYLFSYRALCQEIWRKQRFIEINKLIEERLPPAIKPSLRVAKLGNESGIINLRYFKQEFETALDLKQFENFHFETIEIPRIDICISIPLNIGHGERVMNNIDFHGKNFNEWKIIPTSILNIFPYRSKSYVIAGFHKEHPCGWTQSFIEKMKSGNLEIVQQLISDLITVRLDFWCASPHLFEAIGRARREQIQRLFTENFFNTNSEIETNFNLFKGVGAP